MNKGRNSASNSHKSSFIEIPSYEDDCYIIFDKPPGLLVVPTPKKESKTLVNIVNEQLADRLQGRKLHPCHRLDRETSGLVIFAKGKKHQRLMMNLFKSGKIKKTYLALVHGHMGRKEGTIQSEVVNLERRHYPGFKKVSSRENTRHALTHYKSRAVKNGYSVLEIHPITGRTNQIRIQFSQLGHPLVGDRKYSRASDFALKFRRSALHAAGLEFVHPVTDGKVKIRLELPVDMRAFCQEH